MKLNQIDTRRASIGGVSAAFTYLLEEVLGSLFSYLFFGLYALGPLFGTLLIVVTQVILIAAFFTLAFTVTSQYVFKIGKPKQKEVFVMGLVASLAIIAFQRLLSMLGVYSILSMIFGLVALFIAGYVLSDDMSVEEGENVIAGGMQRTTLYRKEKIVQKGSKAEGFLNYVYLYAWGAGIIFTWGGFIVRPRSQAPAFYAIGIVCLLLAAMWTYQKIDTMNIERYKKIVLPASWPKDCSYEKYHEGLHSKGSKSSGGLFGDKNMKFYNECKNNSIHDLDSEYNMQKAIKIAEKQNVKDFNEEILREMYEKGKTMTETDAANASAVSKENLLKNKRIEELNELAKDMKYYGYHGMEKRKQMLRDLMAEADKKRKDAEMMSQMASRTMLQKEHDWATHGGIASGIAGPAAGVATALDIQAKNAAIREQNAKMMPYVAMVTSSYANTASGYQQEYNKYASDLQATNTKLISTDTKETVFENIVIKNVKHHVSNTGAVRVVANFSINENYRIFNSMKPTIDGCVRAKLMKDGECAGSAYIVFPIEGIITPVTLSAICTKTTDPNASYTIEFEADDVWAMEKL